MKRTKEGTIARYKPEYFANKSEEQIKAFEASPLEKQYYTIMNWRRSVEKAKKKNTEDSSEPTFNSFFKLLNDANKELQKLSNLSSKETEKAYSIIDIIKNNIANFDKIKKHRLLNELLKKERKIQSEIASIKESLNN